MQVSSEKWPSCLDLTTQILVIAQVLTTLLNACMPWKSVKTKYQFVLFRSICITNSFRSNYPRCSLLYSPVTVSFVYRVTTSKYICQGKFREKKLGTGVRISNPCPLPCLTLATSYAMAPNTHTETTETPTSTPIAIAESGPLKLITFQR